MNSNSKIIFIIVYLFMDICWIATMSHIFYKRNIELIQKSPLTLKVLPAIITYITLLIVMFAICIPLSEYYNKKYNSSIVFGLVGFCMYAIYNGTNGSIFTNYSWTFMILDSTWGLVSFALMGYLYALLKN
jgi:uncharacterized membrane protein